MLNVTKAKVCASIVLARSRGAKLYGITTRLKAIWGRKASDSILNNDSSPYALLMCKTVLYTEKLWR